MKIAHRLRPFLGALALSWVATAAHAAEGAPAAAPAEVPLTSASGLPLRKDEDAGTGAAYLFLALLLAGGGALVWAARKGRLRVNGLRWVARTEDAGLDIVASRALGPQGTVHVVRWQGTEFLVGATAHAVNVLAKREVDARSPERDSP